MLTSHTTVFSNEYQEAPFGQDKKALPRLSAASSQASTLPETTLNTEANTIYFLHTEIFFKKRHTMGVVQDKSAADCEHSASRQPAHFVKKSEWNNEQEFSTITKIIQSFTKRKEGKDIRVFAIHSAHTSQRCNAR
jgi:hypothetical protein